MQGNLATLFAAGVAAVAVACLIAAIVLQYVTPNLVRARARTLIAGGSLLILTFAVAAAGFAQYLVWRGDPFTILLLAPHNSASYVVTYVFTRFAAPYVVSGVAGLLGALALTWLNARRGGVLVESHEPALFATALFLSGHPGWLVYLPLLGLVYLPLLAATTLRNGGGSRRSLEYLWLPTALLGILLTNLVLPHLEWWFAVKI